MLRQISNRKPGAGCALLHHHKTTFMMPSTPTIPKTLAEKKSTLLTAAEFIELFGAKFDYHVPTLMVEYHMYIIEKKQGLHMPTVQAWEKETLHDFGKRVDMIYDTTEEDAKGKKRGQIQTLNKMMRYYYCTNVLNWTRQKTGEIAGNGADHSSVINLLNRCESLYETDEEFRSNFDTLFKKYI